MRYVNLKKQRTSKLENNSKKFAIIGVAVMLFTAILVLPATRQLEASNYKEQESDLLLENNVITNDGEVDFFESLQK